jgi:hypothetical protein
MVTLDKIKENVLAESKDDFVGLWSIARQVEDAHIAPDAATVRRVTLALVQDLLNKHLIEAGHPTSDGRSFKLWEFPVEVVMRKIEERWTPTGARPRIGEVVWFTTYAMQTKSKHRG